MTTFMKSSQEKRKYLGIKHKINSYCFKDKINIIKNFSTCLTTAFMTYFTKNF